MVFFCFFKNGQFAFSKKLHGVIWWENTWTKKSLLTVFALSEKLLHPEKSPMMIFSQFAYSRNLSQNFISRYIIFSKPIWKKDLTINNGLKCMYELVSTYLWYLIINNLLILRWFFFFPSLFGLCDPDSIILCF